MYWMDCSAKKIQRANLDGSCIEDVVTTVLNEPVGIALDVASGTMSRRAPALAVTTVPRAVQSALERDCLQQPRSDDERGDMRNVETPGRTDAESVQLRAQRQTTDRRA